MADTTAAYRQLVLDLNPAQFFDLDSADGQTPQDDSGNGLHATATGTLVYSDGGLAFDGTQTVQTGNSVNGGGDYYSFEAVFEVDDPSGATGQVLYEQGGSSNGVSFSVANNRIYCNVYIGATFDNVVSGAITANTTHHVAVHLDNGVGTFTMWIDGVQVDQMTPITNIGAHSDANAIGGVEGTTVLYDGGTTPASFNGTVWTIAVWDGIGYDPLDILPRSKVALGDTAAYFTYTSNGLEATFTDQSQDMAGGSPASWDWDFGDGNTSTAQNPVHTYASSGSYTVELEVTGAGSETDTYSFIVVISVLPDPTAGLTLTEEITPSFAAAVNSTYRDQSFVLSCDIPWPVTPADGFIWENGGSGTGTFVGMIDGGQYFRLRAGDGGVASTAPSSQIDIDTTHIDIPVGLLPFDGGIHNLCWELNWATRVMRVWVDFELIGTSDNPPVGGGGFTMTTGSNWAGGAAGSYLNGAGENTEPDASSVAWAGGTVGASNLRCYWNQTSTWTEPVVYDGISSETLPALTGSSTGTFLGASGDAYDAVSSENLPSLIASTLATFQETLGYQIRAKVSVSGHADVYSNVEEIRYLQLGSAFSASSTVSLPMLTGSFAGTHRQSIKVYVDSNWVPSLAWYWDGSAWIPEHYQTSSGWV